MSLAPGRELDALVAEKVMGWHRDPDPVYHQWCETVDGEVRRLRHCEPNHDVWPWRPSTDIATAWEVIEKMRSQGHWFLLSEGKPDAPELYDRESTFIARIGGYYAEAVTVPHAICLAALAAVDALQESAGTVYVTHRGV